MPGNTLEIVPCPSDLTADALALALSELTPEQRREIAPRHSGGAVECLMVALDGGESRGAAWGQRQPGNTAIFWPPQLGRDADPNAARRLSCAVAERSTRLAFA